MADSREVGEDAAIKKMVDAGLLDGSFSLEKAGHHAGYYATRHICLDCRGSLSIHPGSGWGSWIVVITWSHDTRTGTIIEGEDMSKAVDRPVTVDEGAFIGTRALLYNCHIKHHAIVACGAVVRNMTVESYTIVEGNPAKVIKRFVNGKWRRV